MRTITRTAALFVASPLLVGLGLSQLAPRVSTAAPTRQKNAPAGKTGGPTPPPAAPPSAAASTLRGTLSLFSWGPGFYGFCFNGREDHPDADTRPDAFADAETNAHTVADAVGERGAAYHQQIPLPRPRPTRLPKPTTNSSSSTTTRTR